MSYLLNNQQKFNDVVFEHRNKNYGAYAIRSAYGNTVFKSLLVVTLTVTAFTSIAYLLNRHVDDVEIITGQIPEELIYTNVSLKEPAPNEPQPRNPEPPRPSPGAAAAAAIGTRVVDSLAVTTQTQATVEDLPAVASAATGSAGAVTMPNTGGGLGNGLATTGNGTTTTVSEIYGVEEEPEFEGGLKALYQFISSHLRYPPIAAGDGIEGTAYVKFVVDEKGKVGSVTLRNNLGYGLDEEARRVVSMIPNFKKPARIKGEPVKVYYQLPIKFKLK